MDKLIMITIFLSLISFVFIGMGLFVYFKKQPLILNSRWFLLIVIFCFLPQITTNITSFTSIPTFSIISTITYIVLIVFLAYTMTGYTFLGVDGDDFQKVFIDILKSKDLEFEQTFSKIKIKNPEMEISIAIQSWIGNGQIRPKGKSDKQLFDSILNDLKTTKIKTNMLTPIFYIIIGLLMAAFSIALLIIAK